MERNLTLVALFAALIAALALIPKFSLGFGVPITAQTLGVMLCGTVLGAKRGTLAVLLFLVLVAIGLPLLAGGRGGLGSFMLPSSGFLDRRKMARSVIDDCGRRRVGRWRHHSLICLWYHRPVHCIGQITGGIHSSGRDFHSRRFDKSGFGRVYYQCAGQSPPGQCAFPQLIHTL